AQGWDWSLCKPEDGRRHHTRIAPKVRWRSPCREIAEPARPVGVTSGARPFTWPGAGEPAEELAPPAGPGLSRVAGITSPAKEGLSRDISDFGARTCPVAGESSPRGARGGRGVHGALGASVRHPGRSDRSAPPNEQVERRAARSNGEPRHSAAG